MKCLLLFLVGLLVAGCTEAPAQQGDARAKPSPALTINAPAASKPEAKITLPIEYPVLAEVLGMPLFRNPQDFWKQEDATKVYHHNIMTLQRIKSIDPDITYITNLAQTGYSDSLHSVEQLSTLPKPQSDGSTFVESFIHGALGDVRHGFELDARNQQLQNGLSVELDKLVAAENRIDLAHQLLAKVAANYAPVIPKQSTPQRIFISFDESVRPNELDWNKIYNGGPEIVFATIVVELTGANGETRKNIHFVKAWPQNTWLYCPYTAGVLIKDKMEGRRSVTAVQKVQVTVLSPDLAIQQSYNRTQADKDKDFQRTYGAVKFECGYRPFDPGILITDYRGVYLKMKEVPNLPKCRVTLTFSLGTKSVAWYWDQDSWAQDELKTFQSKDLVFEPEKVEMVLSVTGTNFTHRQTFNLKP